MMLFWSTDSAPVEYTGKRESAAIDAWLDRKLRVRPSATRPTSAAQR